ncbi:hypothetical protein [Arachidicoccus terrestris]|uniref:hypothetical protein n=1 Tax=Arachidicoccus terrestris TaxID=2875539 RepID=UPI001CC6D92A|nr:hypothetical protein [Arachidicoccus terrestris]UAY55053.1 hypothetical protein K9M52_16715 [Arachidicoccus terrestris]
MEIFPITNKMCIMKKLIFGLIMAFALSFCFTGSYAQTTVTTQTTGKQVVKKAKKTQKKHLRTAEKATAKAPASAKVARKNAKASEKTAAKKAKEVKKTAAAKTDATGHHLKKDGTKDMRYKENRK